MAAVRNYQIIEALRHSAFSTILLKQKKASSKESIPQTAPLNRAQKGKADFLVYVILFVLAIIVTLYSR